jgi:hypothetical protein
MSTIRSRKIFRNELLPFSEINGKWTDKITQIRVVGESYYLAREAAVFTEPEKVRWAYQGLNSVVRNECFYQAARFYSEGRTIRPHGGGVGFDPS